MSKRYSTNSIKHDALKRLRQLRDEIARDVEAANQRRKALETARECDATWEGYKANVRPLKRGQGRLF